MNTLENSFVQTAKETYTIVFTDSGLGGLSIMAAFNQQTEEIKHTIPNLDLIFFNALPESGMGYNKLASTQEKVAVFNRALERIEQLYKPDLIAIACNTLSAIYPQTAFSKRSNNVFEIVSIGRNYINQALTLTPNIPVFVLATPTTLASQAYHFKDEIVYPVSGHNLASLIEDDYQSNEVKNIVSSVFDEIAKQVPKNAPFNLFLGCTHYGYISELLWQQAKEKGLNLHKTINPNSAFSDQLSYKLEHVTAYKKVQQPNRLRIESQATILETEIKSISTLLQKQAPELVPLLKNYTRVDKSF